MIIGEPGRRLAAPNSCHRDLFVTRSPLFFSLFFSFLSDSALFISAKDQLVRDIIKTRRGRKGFYFFFIFLSQFSHFPLNFAIFFFSFIMLPVEDAVTYFTLSRHPKNRSLVDIKNKSTGDLCYIKIRHRLANFYALSLVNPKTFEVQAETQVKGANARVKPITLQGYKQAIILKDTSVFGFEWSFEWEKQKFKWVRESPMRPGFECRAIYGRGNDVCIAQYLPRGVKNEYFGLVSVLDYNVRRIAVSDEAALELLLVTSLMTILDKADDPRWRKEIQGSMFLAPDEVPGVQPFADDDQSHDNHDDAGGKQKQWQRKQKTERDIEHRLHWMLEKDVRRSQKQVHKQTAEVIQSQQSSPIGSPRASPLPSPTASTHDLSRLSQQQQQLEHLRHMLSKMKHSNDASATLPPSFVQQERTLPHPPPLASLWGHESDDDDGQNQHCHTLHERPVQRRMSSTDYMPSHINNINNRYSVQLPPRPQCFPQR
ncbi:hypothetical protein BC940DRAFT_302362 [Gongronella butleri]|nr:hypothetical protein BC940DRAFT_302362 [Gongronella butleri]